MRRAAAIRVSRPKHAPVKATLRPTVKGSHVYHRRPPMKRHAPAPGNGTTTTQRALAIATKIQPLILVLLQKYSQGLPLRKINHRLGSVSRSVLMTALSQMKLARHVIHVYTFHGSDLYRLPKPGEVQPGPPVRTLPIPPFDARALRVGIQSLLSTGPTFSARELVAGISRDLPHASTRTVQIELDALVAAGAIAPVVLGSLTRYRKVWAA